MTITDVPDGTRILVDANIILYVLSGKSPQCRKFLSRCAEGSIEGVITTIVVAEVCHRCMLLEASARGLVSSNPVKMLGGTPDKVRELSAYAGEVRNLIGGGLLVEPVRVDDFYLALEFQGLHGLLTNDSLNLAVARRLEIRAIASADIHFDGLAGWCLFRPEDLHRHCTP